MRSQVLDMGRVGNEGIVQQKMRVKIEWSIDKFRHQKVVTNVKLEIKTLKNNSGDEK